MLELNASNYFNFLSYSFPWQAGLPRNPDLEDSFGSVITQNLTV